MKQIIWIQDQNEKTHPGGAQQTNRYMINHGRNLGFKIKEYTLADMETEEDLKAILELDGLFILNNIIKIYMKYPQFINTLITTKEFARYEHDYLWIYKRLPDNLIKSIFRLAKASIFLSPLHLAEHKEYLNGQIRNGKSIPSPIDTRKFRIIDGIERKKGTVIYAGGIGWHKGIEGIIEHAKKNPKLEYHLYGWIEDKHLIENLPSNVKVFPKLPFENIEEVYNKYEFAIHLPNWKEPFGRFIPEAFLCGCEPITNENLGFKSWPIEGKSREELADWLLNSPNQFWETIYRALHI